MCVQASLVFSFRLAWVASRRVASRLRCVCVCVHLNAALPISGFSQIWRTGDTREMQRARSEAIKGGAEGTTRAISCSLQNHSILHFASFTPLRPIFTQHVWREARGGGEAQHCRCAPFTSLHFALDAHSFALEARAHLCTLSVLLWTVDRHTCTIREEHLSRRLSVVGCLFDGGLVELCSRVSRIVKIKTGSNCSRLNCA